MSKNLEDLTKKIKEIEKSYSSESYPQTGPTIEKDFSKEKAFKESFNYCIYLLSKRDYSEYKIRKKLEQRKVESGCIDRVIDYLVEKQYLQEKIYTKTKTKTLILKGLSNFYIKQKLKEEKIEISDDLINQIRDEYSMSTFDSIEYLIDKKLRNKTIPKDEILKRKLKDKVLRFLISKGHTYSDVVDTLNDTFKTSR